MTLRRGMLVALCLGCLMRAAGGVRVFGVWADYRGYLADPDGHLWSGMQR